MSKVFNIMITGIVILYLFLLIFLILNNRNLNNINNRIKQENTILKRDNKKLKRIELKYIVGE